MKGGLGSAEFNDMHVRVTPQLHWQIDKYAELISMQGYLFLAYLVTGVFLHACLEVDAAHLPAGGHQRIATWIPDLCMINPSNAEATFVQSTRMQRFLKII